MSSEVQIAVIDQQDTQIVLAVPGVQGATGSEIAAGGTANQVLRKASSTDYDTDWSLVTSAMIENGAIVDADVNASAAIAGTKISPNFGSQAVVTTGTSTAASFIPTSNTAPTNGLYLPAANNVAISTNGTGRLFVGSDGTITANSPTLYVENSLNTQIKAKFLQNSSSGPLLSLLNNDESGYFNVSVNRSGAGGHTTVQTGADLAFRTGGANERLRITSDGKLGLGTSTVGARFHIEDTDSSSAYTTGAILGTQTSIYKQIVHTNQSTGTNEAGIVLRAGASSNIAEWGLSAVRTGATSGDLLFRTRTGAATSAEIMRLTSTGLGIGVTSAQTRLHVQDSIAGGSGGTVATLQNFSDTGGDTRYVGLNFRIGSDNGTSAIRAYRTNSASNYETNLSFWTNPAGATQDPVRAMTIDSYQRVGIGTANPTQKLQITDGSLSNFYIAPGYNGGAGTTIGVGGGEYLAFNGAPFTTERMRIDSSGRLLVGTTLSTSIATREASIQVASTALAPNVLSGLNTSADQYGPSIALAKSRGGESPAVTSGDALGSIIFAGHDGSDLETAGAYIAAQVDGAVSNNDLPTRLVFSCTPDGAASPTPRMTIKADGDVGIGTTSPGRNLHIASSGNSTLAVERTGATTAALVIAAESNVIKLSARETEGSSAVGRDIQFESGPNATMRIDSSGRLLVGTTTAISPPFLSGSQTGPGSILTNGYDNGRITIVSNSSSGNNVRPASLALVRTGSDANTTTDMVVENYLGSIDFIGRAGGTYNLGATIYAAADGGNARGLGSGDMPSRIVFAVSNDNSASPTERHRIAPDGQWCFNQNTPPTKSTTATLSVGDIRNGLILSDPASGITFTLTSGSDVEGQYGGIYTGMAFEWSIVNINATNTITIANGTNHTYTGNTTIAANTSARFLTRRSASQTFVTYRIA